MYRTLWKKGFTILELLIVISVIAILVGIALPRFKGMTDEGNIARARGELRTLQTAVEIYYIRKGAYPANAHAALTGATPQIIASTPTDPFTTGSAYGYARSPSPFNYYIIYSVGPGGTATITGIDGAGALTGSAGDDIYVSNGASSSGG